MIANCLCFAFFLPYYQVRSYLFSKLYFHDQHKVPLLSCLQYSFPSVFAPTFVSCYIHSLLSYALKMLASWRSLVSLPQHILKLLGLVTSYIVLFLPLSKPFF